MIPKKVIVDDFKENQLVDKGNGLVKPRYVPTQFVATDFTGDHQALPTFGYYNEFPVWWYVASGDKYLMHFYKISPNYISPSIFKARLSFVINQAVNGGGDRVTVWRITYKVFEYGDALEMGGAIELEPVLITIPDPSVIGRLFEALIDIGAIPDINIQAGSMVGIKIEREGANPLDTYDGEGDNCGLVNVEFLEKVLDVTLVN